MTGRGETRIVDVTQLAEPFFAALASESAFAEGNALGRRVTGRGGATVVVLTRLEGGKNEGN